jgi:hypothetical protein
MVKITVNRDLLHLSFLQTMAKRAIKVIKHDETPRVPEKVTPVASESELEAERRSTVKEWIAEYRENDRIEKADDEDQLQEWRDEES